MIERRGDGAAQAFCHAVGQAQQSGALCCFRFPAPADGTAFKRDHDFCVELNTGIRE